MGKTPKKTAPGGDERNLYVRRLKATTATTKTSDTSLPESQREQENLNRPKTAGARKLIVAPGGKQFKSKLRSPVKSGLNNPGKRTTRPVSASSKEERRLAPSSILSSKISKASASSKMQPESEEAEVQLKMSIQKEEEEENEKEVDQQKNQDSVVKESKQVENESKEEVTSEEQPAPKSTETEAEKRESEGQNGKETSQEEKESEETEGCDIKLSFDNEENHKEEEGGQKEERDVVKVAEEKLTEQNSNPEEEHQAEEITNGKAESEVNESQTDTESCSVDVVESTTSELSETNESISQTESSGKDKGKKEGSTTEHEPSFVSYDSSILLKDVKIKLNDCLKDNSTCNIENNSLMDQSVKEMSFGKTLRNISARHSLSRMRNVTLRESRYSPNSSLFVNTSSASINPDDLSDYKVLRYRSNFNDPLSSCNGTPFDRKRKLEPEACSTLKKAKTESKIGLFDSPAFGLLKGSRRPVQVSTPNVSTSGYKFSVEKLNAENESNGEPNAGKKWCVIM